MKKWVKDEFILTEAHHALAEQFQLPLPLIEILISRGYMHGTEIDRFINPCESDLHNPFLMRDMQNAVDRLRTAIEHKEKIGIFSDSDLDGLTSLSLMMKLFTSMDYPACVRYPHTDETYGLTLGIIDEFADKNISLLITLDSGTRDIEEIKYAVQKGIDVIVTDHHEQGENLPDALVINPHRTDCSYPYKYLAGVGVAFKFITAFLYSYLPAYNTLFILVADEESVFYTAELKNGILLSEKNYESPEDLQNYLKSRSPESRIVFMEKDTFSKIGSSYLQSICLEDIISVNKPNTGKEIISGMNKFNSKSETALRLFINSMFYNSKKISDFSDTLLELVAIGTIADVVSLTGENRTLVSMGINSLNKCEHPGLKKLINGETVTSKLIGWSLAPLLNTPGRLGKTELTASFFTETDDSEINNIISELNRLNVKRKNELNEIFSNLMQKINTNEIKSDKNILTVIEAVPEGLTGLLANRLSDKTGMPVIIFSLPGKEGIIKGSGRNTGAMEIFPHVSRFSYLFERIGGHANAFGFSIRMENIDTAVSLITESLDQIEQEEEKLSIDCLLDIAYITPDFIDCISVLEPFGKDNPVPLFLSRNIGIEKFQSCGSDNQHGRYTINSGVSLISAIGWNMAETMKELFAAGVNLDMVYRLENNYFRDNVYPQMIIEDIGISQS